MTDILNQADTINSLEKKQEQVTQERLNQINNEFDYLQQFHNQFNYSPEPKAVQFNNIPQNNIIQDLNFNPQPPSFFESKDDEIDYNNKLDKYNNAKTILGVMQYQIDNDPIARAKLDNELTKAGYNDTSLSIDEKKSILGYVAQKNYESVVNDFGVLPARILRDPNFTQYVDSENYAYLKAMYDNQLEAQGESTNSFVRGIKTSYEQAKTDYNFLDNKDFRKANLEKFYNNFDNAKYDDGLLYDIGLIGSGMIQPFIQRPSNLMYPIAGALISVLSGGIGTPLGAVVASSGVGVAGSFASVDWYRSQITQEAIEQRVGQNKNVDKEFIEQALQDSMNESVAMASLDALGGAVMGAIGTKIGADILKLAKHTKKDPTKFIYETKNRIGFSIAQGLKSSAWITAPEIITEGVQGGIQQFGANRVAGNDNLDEGVLEASIENAKQVTSFMGLVGAVALGTKSFHTYRLTKELSDTITQNVKDIANVNLAEQAPLTQDNPAVAESLYSKAFGDSNTRYAKASDLAVWLERVPDRFKNKQEWANLNTIANDTPDELLPIDLSFIAVHLTPAQKIEAITKTRRSLDILSQEELNAQVKDLTNNNLAEFLRSKINDLNIERARLNQNLGYQKSIYDKLVNARITSPKRAQLISSIAGNMRANFANALGIDIQELEKIAPVKIEKWTRKNYANNNTPPEEAQASGKYNIDNNTMYIKGTDVDTTMHEFAHSFLNDLFSVKKAIDENRLVNIAPANQELFNKQIEILQNQLGIDKNLLDLDRKEYLDVQEQFVNLFTRALYDNKQIPFSREIKRSIKQFIDDVYKVKSIDDNAPDGQKIIYRNNFANKLKQEFNVEDLKELGADTLISEYLRYMYGVVPRGLNADFVNLVNKYVSIDDIKNDNAIPFPNIDLNLVEGIEPQLKNDLTQLIINQDNLNQVFEKEYSNIFKTYANILDDIKKAKGSSYKQKIESVIESYNKDLPYTLTDLNKVKEAYNKLDKVYSRLEKSYLQKDKNGEMSNEMKFILSDRFKINEQEAKELYTPDEYNVLKSKDKLAPDGLTITEAVKSFAPRIVDIDRVKRVIPYAMLDEQERIALLDKLKYEQALSVLTEIKLKKAEVKALDVNGRLRVNKELFNIFKKYSSYTKKNDFNRIESVAKQIASNTRIKDFSFRKEIKNSTDMQNKAIEFAIKGDVFRAYNYLLQSIYYNTKAKQLTDIKSNIEKTTVRLKKKFAKDVWNGENYYYNHIAKEFFVRLGIVNDTQKHRQALEQAKEMYPTEFAKSEQLFKSLSSRYIDTLSFNQFQNILNKIDELMIKENLNILVDIENNKISLEQQAIDLIASLSQHKDTYKVKTKEGYIPDTGAPKFNAFTSFAKTIGKVEAICKYLDKEENGAFTKYIYTPVREALTEYQLQAKKDVHYFTEWTKYFANEKSTQIIPTAQYLGFDLGAGAEYAGNGRLHLAGLLLHLGNDYNKQALIESIATYKKGFDEKALSNFIDTMIKKGFIDESMLEQVQKIWSFYDEVGARSNKAFIKVKGHAFKFQEKTPIVFRIGNKEIELSGGYVPLMTNKDTLNADIEVKSTDDLDKLLTEGLALFDESNFKERTRIFNGTGKIAIVSNPLELLRRAQKMELYAFLAPTINNVNKLLYGASTQVASVMDKKYKGMADEVFKDWLIRVANDRTIEKTSGAKLFFKTMRFLKTTSSCALMFFNINNTVQGLSQFVQLKSKVEIPYIQQALKNTLSREYKNQIISKSKFLQSRRINASFLDIDRDLITNPKIVKGFKNKTIATAKLINRIGQEKSFFLQKYMQDYMDLVVWESAYRKYQDLNYSEHDCITQADSVVRMTSSSYDSVDLTKFETQNAFVQLFTQFGGYFYTMANNFLANTSIAWRDSTRVKRAVDTATQFMYAIYLPSIVAEIIARSFAGDWWAEEKNDDGINTYAELLLSPTKTIFSMIPVAGQVGTSLYNTYVKGMSYYTDSYFNLASFTLASTGFKGAQKLLQQGTSDEQVRYTAIRDASILLSFVFPPSYQVGKLLAYMYGVEAGQITPTSEFDYLRGIVSGGRAKQGTQNN